MIGRRLGLAASRRHVQNAWVAFCGLVALLIVFAASPAWAQSQPVVELAVESTVVGLGEAFDVRLVAQGEEMPRFPELELPAGLAASRPSVSASTNVSITNGVRVDRLGIEAHWSVRAAQTGTFTLGPATARIGDRVVSSRRVTVRVVRDAPRDPAGGRGRRPSVFDPFGMFGKSPFDDPFKALEQQELQEPEGDPAFALDAPPSPGVFMIAKADKASAFVGEQVTFSVLLYADARLQDPQFTDLHEAPAPQFLRQSLLDDTQPPKFLAYTHVGTGLFRVYQLRKVALFPLAPGSLTIAPMRLQFVGPHGGERLSRAVEVRVSETPLKGRPPGYAPGSVGAFTLVVEVQPREVSEGGTFVVKATLAGRGTPPPHVELPQGPAFEWLEPDVQDAFAGDEQGRWGGRRTFTWAVRAKEAGEKNLGKMQALLFDGERRAYARLSAELGAMKVSPRVGPAPKVDVERRGLEALPAPLANAPEPRVQALRKPVPAMFFAAPVVFALLVPLAALARFGVVFVFVHARAFAKRKPSFSRMLAGLEREAAKAAPAAVERVTTRVVDELAAGLSGRVTQGLRDDEVAGLLQNSLAPGDADELLRILRDARDARFSGLTNAVEARTRLDASLRIARKYAGKVT